MTSTWNIEQVVVDKIDTSKAVAHWRVNAEDGNTVVDIFGNKVPNAASVYGTQVIETVVKAGVDGATIIAAVKTAMGDERVAEIEAGLEAQLASNLNPPTATFTFDENGKLNSSATMLVK
jgi:hypothetical protein